MNEELITGVKLAGSARDTLKRLYQNDIAIQTGAFDVEEQQDRILSQFIEEGIPDEPVMQKAYFADLARNGIATIQGSKASSGIKDLEDWWTNHAECSWSEVINGDLVLKVDSATHVPLRFATAQDLETIYQRRMAEAEAKMEGATRLGEMVKFFKAILGYGKQMENLTDKQLQLALEPT